MKVVDVDGYKGKYTIREDAVVHNAETGKEVTRGSNSRGYSRVFLHDGTKQKAHSLHRLVAKAFIPNPNDYPQVDHIDEDKNNNHVSNLRWCTAGMNVRYYTEVRKRLRKEKVIDPGRTREAFMERASKKIHINGIEYPSIRDAARYIADKEGKSLDTIRKEIRNFVKGKRPSWWMYDKYHIS